MTGRDAASLLMLVNHVISLNNFYSGPIMLIARGG